MANIPNAVLSDRVRQLLDGRRVTAAAFLTYTFESQFFEEEIVPLLTNESLSLQPKVRLVQIEDLLRSAIGPIAVYYDQAGLKPEGAARLDVRYKPLHVPSGVFHPKAVLLLTEPDQQTSKKSQPALICGILSANLTKSGWWSCLESAHFEVAVADTPCSFREDLRSMLNDVLRLGLQNGPHDALEKILAFVRKLPKDAEQTTRARLRPRICAGRQDFINFLSETRGQSLEGRTLEIISPFFDQADASIVRRLSDELSVRKTFVFHPRKNDGSSPCSEAFYDDLRSIPRVKWAKLRGEDSLLRLGNDKNARPRSVHAKVYRFTSTEPAYEAIAVGSHNLTGPALRNGGNYEASFFLEVEPEKRVESWLETDDVRPELFEMVDPELVDQMADEAVIPLQVQFDWSAQTGSMYWGAYEASPAIELSLLGAVIFGRESLPPNEWIPLDESEVNSLRAKLISTALLTVTRLDDGRQAVILVQENGMESKESILLSWSPADVLAYWSQLNQTQRTQYLERRLLTNSIENDVATQQLKLLAEKGAVSLFETSAGIFHGFEMLRDRVCGAIENNQFATVDYLFFGKRHDSLPTLLFQIEQNADGRADSVARYLYGLSAIQTIATVRAHMREHAPEKYQAYRKRFQDVEKLTGFVRSVRKELNVGADGEDFLDWFDEHFRQRVKAVPTVNQ